MVHVVIYSLNMSIKYTGPSVCKKLVCRCWSGKTLAQIATVDRYCTTMLYITLRERAVMQALCAYSEDRRAAGASSVPLNLLTGLSVSRIDPVNVCVH